MAACKALLSPEKSYRNYRKALRQAATFPPNNNGATTRAVTPYIAVHIGDVIRVCDEENYGETESVSLATIKKGCNLLRLAKVGAVIRDIFEMQSGAHFYVAVTSAPVSTTFLRKDLQLDLAVANPLMFVLKTFRSFAPAKMDKEISRIRKLAKAVVEQ